MKFRDLHPLVIGSTLVTFCIALLIFLGFVMTGDSHYALMGVYFFLIAGIVNLIVLIYLAVVGGKGIGLLFINLPFAFIFTAIAIYLTGIMRITFVNDSGETIRNLHIEGCEKEYLDELENGDSETIWINIEGDCQIELSYSTENGKRKNETVMGYVTNGMGHKYVHHIGKSEYENINN